MSDLELELLPVLAGRRALVGWMLAAFLLTFLITRAITHAIRAGRGPFRDTSVNGVHVHHQVYGIFLLLGTGTAEFTRRNATGSRPDTPRRVVEGAADDIRTGWVIAPDGLVARGAPGRGQE